MVSSDGLGPHELQGPYDRENSSDIGCAVLS
jgi:hypothetical protein